MNVVIAIISRSYDDTSQALESMEDVKLGDGMLDYLTEKARKLPVVGKYAKQYAKARFIRFQDQLMAEARHEEGKQVDVMQKIRLSNKGTLLRGKSDRQVDKTAEQLLKIRKGLRNINSKVAKQENFPDKHRDDDDDDQRMIPRKDSVISEAEVVSESQESEGQVMEQLAARVESKLQRKMESLEERLLASINSALQPRGNAGYAPPHSVPTRRPQLTI